MFVNYNILYSVYNDLRLRGSYSCDFQYKKT